MDLSNARVSTRIRRGTVAVVVTAISLLTFSVPSATALTTPASTLTSSWLAAQVASDGSVNIPGETFSVTTQTMYVADGLAASGQNRDALTRAMGYIATHVDEWVVNDGSGSTVAPIGSDLPERLGELILLVHTVGGDPTHFGTPATNLVARTQALYGISVPDFYGWQEPYSAVQDQGLVIMALNTVGASAPAAAAAWIVDQQCTGGADDPASIGGWMSFRPTTNGVLDPCTAPDPINYTGADTNSTAFAIQALVNAQNAAAVPAGLAFLHQAQSTSGPQAGGFPWFTGGDADPNSTALVIQALLAAGESPTGSYWTVGGQSPSSILPSWQLTTPATDAGSFYASWQPGVPSLLATYQGLWGLTLTAFPFPVLTPESPAVDPTVPVVAPDLVPTFTG